MSVEEKQEENLEAFLLQEYNEGTEEEDCSTFDSGGCIFTSKWFSSTEDVFASKEYEEMVSNAHSNICILNENGVIIYTNFAWSSFSSENGGNDSFTGIGTNYLNVCDSASSSDTACPLVKSNAKAFYEGLSRLLGGDTREEISLVYPCDSPQEKRWFLARAFTFNLDSTRRTVVCHRNITKEKEQEELLEQNK